MLGRALRAENVEKHEQLLLSFAGAILIGSKVSDTIWKDIVDVQIYKGEERILMLGELAALISAAVWLMIATVMKIPVSGTHCTEER